MKRLNDVREGRRFTDKEIKQAYGILNDPRYKQGNYSGAVKAIEKLKRGLSKHPSVANALKRANEDINEYGGPKMSKKDYHEYGKNYHKEETLHEITLPRKEFDKIKKVKIKDLVVNYFLDGNDLVINDLESFTVEQKGEKLYISGKQKWD